MELKIIFSDEATEDLEKIVSFIAIDNPKLARDFGYQADSGNTSACTSS